jgi:hypothetical protein
MCQAIQVHNGFFAQVNRPERAKSLDYVFRGAWDKFYDSITKIYIIYIYTTFKMTFRDFLVVRERRFRALVLQNHPKGIRLFEHSENNLT